MTTYAEVESKLVKVIPGYQRRPAQEALALGIEQAFSTKDHFLGNAGCGTGKSFAGLIPAILSRKRVVVATFTKALQDQLCLKDLPDLQAFFAKEFNLNFKWALLKGRSNYFCGARAEGVDPSEVPDLGAILKVLNEAGPEFAGEKEDFEAALGHEIPFKQWNLVRSESEFCADNQCSKEQGGTCCASRARKNAAGAHIVVVNHALFAMDLIYSNAMLGDYQAVIFDEAHELRKAVRSALGNEFSEGSLIGLIGEVRNIVARDYSKETVKVAAAAKKLSGAQMVLFNTFKNLKDIKSGGTTARLRKDDFTLNKQAWSDYVNAAGEYANIVEHIASHLNDQSARSLTSSQKRLQNVKKRARNLAARINNLVEADHSKLVRWVENTERGFVVKSCPIDIAPYLKEQLFDTTPCILISATLTVRGKFDFIANQLGVEDYNSIDVGTPFDFQKQALMYVPSGIADPSKDRNLFSQTFPIYLLSLLKASNGRALVLFTAKKAMQDAYAFIAPKLEHNCFIQGGEYSNKELAAKFKEDTHSVLFGSESFMTGVDFQGETCSLVVMVSLPFPVPTEPLYEAEAEIISQKVGDYAAFNQLSVPMMGLKLAQAYGRLIRTVNDRGVIAMLDPRLLSKKYGKDVLRGLPNAPLTHDIADVESFLAA